MGEPRYIWEMPGERRAERESRASRDVDAGSIRAWAAVAWMPVTAEHSLAARTNFCGWCASVWLGGGALRKLPLEILVELATSDN